MSDDAKQWRKWKPRSGWEDREGMKEAFTSALSLLFPYSFSMRGGFLGEEVGG